MSQVFQGFLEQLTGPFLWVYDPVANMFSTPDDKVPGVLCAICKVLIESMLELGFEFLPLLKKLCDASRDLSISEIIEAFSKLELLLEFFL